MTIGNLKGKLGAASFTNLRACHPDRRFLKITPGCALALAVFAALYPGATYAADEAFPEVRLQPVSRPIQAAAPLAADMTGGQLIPAESHSSEEPAPPGEGPADEIDSSVMTGGMAAPSFWKPEVHVGATASVVFDDNIFITNQDAVSDTTYFVSARATLAFGNVQTWAARFIDTTSRAIVADQDDGSDNLIAISYAPTASFYSSNSDLDSVDHDVAGTMRWNFSKIRIAFDGRFQTLSEPDEDLGRRADRNLSSARVALIYDLTEKARLQFDSSILNRDYNDATDSTQIEGNVFALYDLMPKTTVGIGFGGGELKFQGDSSQTFEKAVARVSYNTYSKWVFNLTGGVEFRQSDITDEGDTVNGIFRLGAVYTPTENSEILFSATRSVEPSASSQAQSVERTTFSIGLNQKLFQKFSLSTNLNYAIADYQTPESSSNFNRSDDLFSANVTLTFEVTQNGFVRFGYTYRQNDSSRNTISYDANQYLISATILF